MIPTVNVTVAVHEQDGSPVRDALVLAKLTAVERYNGYVVADEYTGRTDERGRAVVAVFPNELGSEGSDIGKSRMGMASSAIFCFYVTGGVFRKKKMDVPMRMTPPLSMLNGNLRIYCTITIIIFKQ